MGRELGVGFWAEEEEEEGGLLEMATVEETLFLGVRE